MHKITGKTAILAAVLALSFYAVPGAVLAGTASFNNGAGDGATLLVMNVTQNGSSATNWAGSVNAKPGDTVSFDIYYHNTGDIAAVNTVANLSINPSNTNVSASASVSADNASAANGSASITLPSGYTNVRLTFVSGEWYQNQGSVHVGLPGGPNTFSLGTVQPGWPNQGDLIVRFRVDADAVNNPTPSSEPNAHGFHDGQTGQQTQANCAANGWAMDPDSPTTPVSVKIRVDGMWTYTATANLFRSDLQAAGVCSAAGGSCAFNQQLTLTSGPHTITVVGVDNETGQEVPLSRTGKSIECSAVVQPPVCPALTVTTGSATGPSQTQATVTGTVSGPANVWVEYGPTQNLGFTTPTQQTNGGAVNFTLTGLQANTTYYFRLVAQGTQTGCNPVQGQILNFITQGTTQCTAPTASVNTAAPSQNSAVVSGTVNPNGNTVTYYFTYGTISGVLTFTTPAQTISGSGPQTVTATLSNLQANTLYYYQLVIQSSCGANQSQQLSFTTTGGGGGTCNAANTPSAVTGIATPLGQSSEIITGVVTGSPTSIWFEYGTSNALGQTVPAITNSATLTGLQPNTTYFYRIVGQNSCGTSQGQILSFTTQPANACNAPTVATGGASNFTQTSATISATVSPNGTVPTSDWFEWGTDPNLINPNTTQTQNASGSMTMNLTGLTAGTAYYYRAVGTNCGGTQKGVIQQFSTLTGQCTAPTASLDQATPNQNSAAVSGTINPNGSTVTYYFAYGTISGVLTFATPAQTISGSGPQSVNATLQSLQPNTLYYYQLVIQSSCANNRSQQLSFTTTGGGSTCNANNTPVATTGSYSGVSQNSATVTGTVTGSPNSIWFEYGTTQSLGQTISASGGSVTLTGLQSNTTYYYRIVGQNPCGTSQGQILSFTTTGQTNICTDPNATNYGGSLPCVYQQRCTDPNAANYGQVGQCFYPQRCTDPRATNYNQIGQCVYNYNQCQAPSIVGYSAANTGQNSATLNAYINPNGYSTTYWFQYGTNYSFGYSSQTQGPLYGNYAQNVSSYVYGLNSNTTYYFNVVAQNQCGTAYGPSTMSFVTGGGYNPPVYPQGQGPTVITNATTNITNTSALLNGQVNPNGYNATGWLEYGTSLAFGNTTPAQSLGSGYGLTNISFPASGLQPNTIYFVRAAGQNQYGINYGQTLSFKTGGVGVIVTNQPPTYTYNPPVVATTAVAAGSCLVLIPAIDPANPLPNGDFAYAITYRNDCPYDLLNAALHNYLPTAVDFSATSYPFVTRDLNVITYNLGNVPRGFQNTILVKGLIKPTVNPGDSLVYKSDISFADGRGRIQGVSSFLTATVAGGATGTGVASILDTLLGFLSSGWFWFLLFLLFLAMFVLWLATRERHGALESE